MATVYDLNEKSYRVFVKGAPDYMIDDCLYFSNCNGELKNIDKGFKENLNKTIKSFA